MNIQQWVDKHYKRKASDNNYSHIRLGQAFCNFMYENNSRIEYAKFMCQHNDIFNVEDDKEALLMIMQWLESKPDNYFETLTKGM